MSALDVMSDPAPKPKHLIICVVTGTRAEVSLMAAISMLRLQIRLMASQTPIRADMHFVPDINAALHTVYATEDADEQAGALVVDGSMGFDTDFVLRALDAPDVPLLLGVYPLPTIDWDRVRTCPAGEDPQNWGNVYNVQPLSAPDARGYVVVDRTSHLGMLWLRAGVLRDIAARHPEVVGGEGDCAFACAGKYDGLTVSAHRRFLDLYGGRILADPRAGASSSGATEFGGCVGARNVLR